MFVENTRGFTPLAVFPLSAFNFTVTDSVTKAPVVAAFVAIHAGINATGDGDGLYTDSQGKVGLDAVWFAPRSWSVTKEGYDTVISNTMTTQTYVEIVPIDLQYTVRIFAGTGGSTSPSGQLNVEPNSQLSVTAYPYAGYVFDHWLYKGENVGTVNPHMFLIDRDAITIAAVFNAYVPPPPPNGDGNGSDNWPIVKTDHVFDNIRLDPGIFKEAQETEEKEVDTARVLGGQVEYSVKLESSLTTACTYFILWNNEILKEEGFQPWDPHGTIKSGMLMLPKTKIRNINTLTILLSQVPGLFNRVIFNVYVTLGYSTEPVDPPWGGINDWTDWVRDNALWLAIGGVALGATAVYLAKPAVPTVIVQLGKDIEKVVKKVKS